MAAVEAGASAAQAVELAAVAVARVVAAGALMVVATAAAARGEATAAAMAPILDGAQLRRDVQAQCPMLSRLLCPRRIDTTQLPT